MFAAQSSTLMNFLISFFFFFSCRVEFYVLSLIFTFVDPIICTFICLTMDTAHIFTPFTSDFLLFFLFLSLKIFLILLLDSSFSLPFTRCVQNLFRLKLYLPKQKWTMNEMFIFFEILYLTFSTQIPKSFLSVVAQLKIFFIPFEALPLHFF